MDEELDRRMMEQLEREFPDLRYPDWFAESDRKMAFIVYESVFADAIKRELLDSDGAVAFLSHAFGFLERLETDVPIMDDIIRVAVLETIHSVPPESEASIRLARSMMGPRLLRLSDRALTTWGRSIPQ